MRLIFFFARKANHLFPLESLQRLERDRLARLRLKFHRCRFFTVMKAANLTTCLAIGSYDQCSPMTGKGCVVTFDYVRDLAGGCRIDLEPGEADRSPIDRPPGGDSWGA